MPMTKKELAMLEDAETRASLAWPPYEKPKPLTPEEIKAIEKEEVTASRYGKTPEPMMLTPVFATSQNGVHVWKLHVDGLYVLKGASWSHFGGPYFRTAEEAYRYAHWLMCESAAAELFKLRKRAAVGRLDN